MSLRRRLLRLFRRRAGRYNLHIEPAYAIKASARNPYFQALERAARQAGLLGSFIVDHDGCLRPGTSDRLETRKANLTLDVYPNPAAIEGRTVGDYDEPLARSPQPPRRAARATIVLDDDTELFLCPTPTGLRLEQLPAKFRR